MEVSVMPKKLDGLYEISCAGYCDNRGYLRRIYDSDIFEGFGIHVVWTQQSVSYTLDKQTVRGLHVQKDPLKERKLISIASGKMFWVNVDVRKNSPTFGRWESTVLSPDKTCGLFVESGFLHGCLSLSDDVLLVLNTDNPYSAKAGIGVLWNDPEINIEWPFEGEVDGMDTHSDYMTFRDFCEKFGGI